MGEEMCKNCKYHFIEEISFDYPQSCCNKENIIGTTEPFLHCKDFEYSKDYITNLQQENKQLKEKIDILLEDNNQLEEIRIKAIEYIKNNSHKVEWGDPESQDEESIDINDDTTETEFIEQLLEILGDKE